MNLQVEVADFHRSNRNVGLTPSRFRPAGCHHHAKQGNGEQDDRDA